MLIIFTRLRQSNKTTSLNRAQNAIFCFDDSSDSNSADRVFWIISSSIKRLPFDYKVTSIANSEQSKAILKVIET